MQENYTVEEIAQALSVPRATVYRWVSCKWLKATPQKKRNYLITREDLKVFIKNPPSPMTRGLFALKERSIIRGLVGDE